MSIVGAPSVSLTISARMVKTKLSIKEIKERRNRENWSVLHAQKELSQYTYLFNSHNFVKWVLIKNKTEGSTVTHITGSSYLARHIGTDRGRQAFSGFSTFNQKG